MWSGDSKNVTIHTEFRSESAGRQRQLHPQRNGPAKVNLHAMWGLRRQYARYVSTKSDPWVTKVPRRHSYGPFSHRHASYD